MWTNADRIFNWMLRQLSFIRPDFNRLRADIYPIRLWTVAVFLFGVLPLLRKHGIGRLIIGDEFDTTERSSFHGITHYAGLFDQSRYFDNALSRYFARKHWNICQFSILRTMSELLIEKVLVKRYPEHQRLQTSCHATHMENEQAKPCGNCEKCRRIVGMLTALGADPKQCGYTQTQIDQALTRLSSQSVHQESAGVEQMLFMLLELGKLPDSPMIRKLAKPRPEILQLRFEPERSPIESIPNDLRQQLYSILLEYANGAVERKGRGWLPFDPLSETALSRPYPYQSTEPEADDDRTKNQRSDAKNFHLLGELTWPEAKQRFQEVDVALLPVGAIEQHGLHLPLDTDAFDADIARISQTPGDVHAGEIETSTTLAIRPHLVKMEQAKSFVPNFSSRYLNFSSKRSVEWYARTAKISSSGVLGDATKATIEKGQEIWAVMIKNLVELVEDLKSMTLDEIYERKY